MRDRLIELLKSNLPHFQNDVAYWSEEHIGELADHLIDNGVIVPLCKVGDEVFQVYGYFDCDIDGYSVCDEYAKDEDIACEYCKHNVVKKYVKTSIYKHGMFEEIGKTIFLTKEEAERALKEREKV